MTIYQIPAQVLNVASAANSAQTLVSLSIPAENITVTTVSNTISYNVSVTGNTTNFNILLANVTFTFNSVSNTYIHTVVSSNGAFATYNIVSQGITYSGVPFIAPEQPDIAGTYGLFDGIIQASGNNIVNGAGYIVQLTGASFLGLDSCGAQGLQPWGGIAPNWNYYFNWKPNSVRIPLNAASWLGLTCYPLTSNGTAWGNPQNCDPYGNYRANITQTIKTAQSNGCYVILCLSLCRPNVTVANVTHYLLPSVHDSAMADIDTAIPFWTSISQTFGTNAPPISGINPEGVIFELYNIPYLDVDGSTLLDMGGNSITPYQATLNGGTDSVIYYNDALNANSGTINFTWNIAGYQQMTNAVRATGATNLLLIGAPSFSSDLTQWLNYTISDTQNNFATSWHTYTNQSYPYTGGTYYPGAGAAQNFGGTIAVMNTALGILSAGYPIVITEDGGSFGPAANVGEPHVNFMTQWVNLNGVSYLSYEFDTVYSNTSNGTGGLQALGNTPTIGQGVVTYNWMISQAANVAAGANLIVNPIISSLSPASVTAGNSGFTLQVSGTTFNSNSIVVWNGTNLTTTYSSGTLLTAAVPSSLLSSPGSANVYVNNSGQGGGISSNVTFTIAAASLPTITSLSPSSAFVGNSGFTLSVNGTNFTIGAVVVWNGANIATTVSTSTLVTAVIPSSDFNSVSSANVAVRTSSGISGNSVFIINPLSPPAISSISPTSVTAGNGGFTLTVTGSFFDSTAKVAWNAANLTTTVINANSLTAVVPSGNLTTPGTEQISVKAANGVSGNVTFTVNSASIIAPSAVTNFLLTNQGGNNTSDPDTSSQNSQTITWGAATAGTNPLSRYQIYRNNVAYANVSSSTFTYTDVNANGSTAAIMNENYSGPSFGFPANVYSYSVRAVDTSGIFGAVPTKQTFWVYHNGVSAFGSNSNYNAPGITMNMTDTSGVPQNGAPFDISINITQGGSFNTYIQPYSNFPASPLWAFEVGAFNYLTIDLKPTASNQTWRFNILSRIPAGDLYNESTVILGDSSAKYGPQSAAGKWATYKIPLGNSGNTGLQMGNTTFQGYISGTTLTITSVPTGIIANPTMWLTTPGGFTTDFILASKYTVQNGGTPTNSETGTGAQGTYSMNVSHGNWGSAGSPITFTGQRTNYYKYALFDLTGLNNNTYYIDNIGLTT